MFDNLTTNVVLLGCSKRKVNENDFAANNFGDLFPNRVYAQADAAGKYYQLSLLKLADPGSKRFERRIPLFIRCYVIYYLSRFMAKSIRFRVDQF